MTREPIKPTRLTEEERQRFESKVQKESEQGDTDEASRESFPASDPPSFAGGAATPTEELADKKGKSKEKKKGQG